MAYDVVIRYSTQERGDWEDALITVIRPEPYDPEGQCANSHPSLENDVELRLPQYHTSQVALYEVCLEQGKTYIFNIAFRHYRKNENNPAAQILIDSVRLYLMYLSVRKTNRKCILVDSVAAHRSDTHFLRWTTRRNPFRRIQTVRLQ